MSRRSARLWRAGARGATPIAMTPTMGALHAGHVSLVTLARQKASRVVMSIFVNPAQFAPNEDFSAYPRTFEADVELFSPPAATPFSRRRSRRSIRRASRPGWKLGAQRRRGLRTVSGRRILPASRQSWPSCSTSAGPMSRSSAKRISSNSASSRGSPATLISRRDRRRADGAGKGRPRVLLAQYLSFARGAQSCAGAPCGAGSLRL